MKVVLSVTDDARDVIDGYRYEIDWGDGTQTVTRAPYNGIDLPLFHTYRVLGQYTIRVTAVDAGGLVSSVSTHNVSIIPAAIFDGRAFIGGSDDNDIFELQAGTLRVYVNGDLVLDHPNAIPITFFGLGGNDEFRFGQAYSQPITFDGGSGDDRLRLVDGGRVVDLQWPSNLALLNTETIDIAGTGNNVLNFDYAAALSTTDDRKRLTIQRNAGDTIEIGPGWYDEGTQSIDGKKFKVYSQGNSIVNVQVPEAAVVNRQVFYNRSTSTVFGNGSGNPVNAIDPTKTALLPGQTTTVANYTNYSRGLNGIVIDVANATNLTGISSASFQFAIWNDFAGVTPNFVFINPNVTVSTIAGVD